MVLFPLLHVGFPLGSATEVALGGLGSASVKARCGGGTAAWVAGVLAAPGTQGSWWLGSRKYSVLEG